MAISQLLGRLFGAGSSGVTVKEFDCPDCGNTFDSAKVPARAQCPECLSDDVEPIGPIE